MAKKTTRRPMRSGYVYGAAARKREYAADLARREEAEREAERRAQMRRRAEERRRRSEMVERRHHVQRNQEKAFAMSRGYVAALILAAVFTLILCVNYIRLQADITRTSREIASMELRLEQKKSENDALQTRIDTYLNLDHIKDVATNELGMVYANKNQILLYDKTESEYVRQHEDIPTP